MHRIKFIHQPRVDGGPGRGLLAGLASCTFHVLVFCLLLGLTFLYASHLPPKSGSAPGAPSITLEAMVIVPPPPVPAPAPVTIPPPQPREPEAPPPPPIATVPVLAVQPSKPAPPTPVKTRAATRPVISPAPAATAQTNPKPAAAPASSYAPGLSVLPHPPYPTEARNRGQTGTVIMNVQFDAEGNVAHAEVAQSSGVPILDSETRSFIRTHWHSAAYAGQTISQPVQYSLENL
jgi:protein TonB